MIFFHLFARFPWFFLRGLAASLYVFLYLLSGYRKAVVRKNLAASFPEKSFKELRSIERRFYWHLADLMTETPKILALEPQQMADRVRVHDLENIEQFLKKGQSVIAFTTHQGNWEWALAGFSTHSAFQVLGVYKPIRSAFFERLMLRTRSKFGADLVPMKSLLKRLIQRRREGQLSVIGLIADQRPLSNEVYHSTLFLNQKTLFYNGGEKLAHKFGLPVVYFHMKKAGRNRYDLYCEPVAEPPYEVLLDGEITERYVRLLEKHIQEDPHTWLWSHERWRD